MINKIFPYSISLALGLILFSGNTSAQFTKKTDSIFVKLSHCNKSKSIHLYTDAAREALFFSASGEDGKLFQLFMFDMDSRLVLQMQVQSRQTALLSNFENGNYLLEIFSNDERIGSGSLTKK